MKLRCVDGIVRIFEVAREDGKLYGIIRQEGYTEACCSHCGHTFGVYDTKIIKPRFKKHICKGKL